MKKFYKFVAIILVISLSSCVTKALFDANVEGASIYIDNEYVGKTPTTIELSDAVWNDPTIKITAEGYKDLYTSLNKEVKVGPLIGGIFFIWPLFLWCYGPKKIQHFELEPIK